jgi:hypothetical protein
MNKMEIFDPTLEAKEENIAFVPRPESLRNLCAGLIDNTKFNSDKLLLKIATILEKNHGLKSHILRRKHNSSVPVHKDVINELVANCQVVITGIGD